MKFFSKRMYLDLIALFCLALLVTAVRGAGVTNPYGLDALWYGGDFIARGTLIILILMSSISWYIIVIKVVEQQKLVKLSKTVQKTFWKSTSLDSAIEEFKKDSVFKSMTLAGKQSLSDFNNELSEKIDLNSWILKSMSRPSEHLQNNLQEGLSFLATVGATAPFIGLFGTVWGIYHALTAIGVAGQASIDKVAGPVGEALIMTAMGLAVATPAAIAYNMILRRNKKIMEDVRLFSSDLHSMFLRGVAPNKVIRRI